MLWHGIDLLNCGVLVLWRGVVVAWCCGVVVLWYGVVLLYCCVLALWRGVVML